MDSKYWALVLGGGAFLLVYLLRRPASATALAVSLTTEPIYFEFDSSVIDVEGQDRLARLAHLLERTDQRIKITGHTDSEGDPSYNLSLGLRRAEEVAAFLLTLGIPEGRIADIQSEGETNPIADNTTAEGRAQNRRVEVKITS